MFGLILLGGLVWMLVRLGKPPGKAAPAGHTVRRCKARGRALPVYEDEEDEDD